MKTCTKCGIEKPLEEFHLKRGKPQAQCKLCRAEYMSAHYQSNLQREKSKRKDWYEKNRSAVCEKMRVDRVEKADEINLKRRLKKFALTEETYIAMLKTCNDSCMICLKPFAETPHIDHCHETSVVRGLLCSKCNTGFGLFEESVATLQNCITYALKYKK